MNMGTCAGDHLPVSLVGRYHGDVTRTKVLYNSSPSGNRPVVSSTSLDIVPWTLIVSREAIGGNRGGSLILVGYCVVMVTGLTT